MQHLILAPNDLGGFTRVSFDMNFFRGLLNSWVAPDFGLVPDFIRLGRPWDPACNVRFHAAVARWRIGFPKTSESFLDPDAWENTNLSNRSPFFVNPVKRHLAET